MPSISQPPFGPHGSFLRPLALSNRQAPTRPAGPEALVKSVRPDATAKSLTRQSPQTPSLGRRRPCPLAQQLAFLPCTAPRPVRTTYSSQKDTGRESADLPRRNETPLSRAAAKIRPEKLHTGDSSTNNNATERRSVPPTGRLSPTLSFSLRPGRAVSLRSPLQQPSERAPVPPP